MGEVYLAHDTKLDRKIALKLLPVDFVSDRLVLYATGLGIPILRSGSLRRRCDHGA